MTDTDDGQIDHLVIAAYRLEAGVDYINHTLGVRMEPGGVHTSMGTHNALLKLGDGQYLEVIAPDPSASNPNRPRWFSLDSLSSYSTPRLVTWVVITSNIQSSILPGKDWIGRAEHMSRGDYKWIISIPTDGSMPFHGIVPAFIEWQVESHPVEKLTDTGCKLIKMEAYHQEPERILSLYESLGIDGMISVFPLTPDEQPYLAAYIETPIGLKKLSGRIA
jgi:hypothetical protein